MEKNNSPKTYKKNLEYFFVEKNRRFWKDRIMKLPPKWQINSETKWPI